MTVAGATSEAAARLASIPQILKAGLLGGLVDFVYACGLAALVLKRPVLSPWQGVASGWIGPAARDMGWASAALGVATHFAIAIAMAAAYALGAARLPLLVRQPVLGGALYGLVLYAVMYGIVLPLRFPQRFPRWDGLISVADVAAHVGVGLAIALVLARALSRP
ncbi:hypothetical protein [Phenylobacterium sp.]|uniref:hypothetical protein n=1 Tax=Phenylobacterium sp. TaxID=1871053 RepID=UPI0035AE4FC7